MSRFPVPILRRLSLSVPSRPLVTFALPALAACLCAGPAQARTQLAPYDSVAPMAGVVHYSFANPDGYQASEAVGSYPLMIDRDDATSKVTG